MLFFKTYDSFSPSEGENFPFNVLKKIDEIMIFLHKQDPPHIQNQSIETKAPPL